MIQLLNQLKVAPERGERVSAKAQEIQLESEDIATAFAVLLPSPRIYISGVLTLEDAEDLAIASRPDQFNPLTLQPGAGVTIIHLESASPTEIISKLGDYFATGTLIVRSIYV